MALLCLMKIVVKGDVKEHIERDKLMKQITINVDDDRKI